MYEWEKLKEFGKNIYRHLLIHLVCFLYFVIIPFVPALCQPYSIHKNNICFFIYYLQVILSLCQCQYLFLEEFFSSYLYNSGLLLYEFQIFFWRFNSIFTVFTHYGNKKNDIFIWTESIILLLSKSITHVCRVRRMLLALDIFSCICRLCLSLSIIALVEWIIFITPIQSWSILYKHHDSKKGWIFHLLSRHLQ
jgi:hypothetical protein